MIFCVEDDSSIRDLMLYTLSTAGFEAKGFADGTDFFHEMKKEMPELVMLDIMLPGEDGIHILSRLRKDDATVNIPVIIVSAKGTEYDKVIALDLGADDYLAKPFGMMEMVSRVRAVLRRFEQKKAEKILRIGKLAVNTDAHTVEAAGERISLTHIEYKLLLKFMENIGMAFTREQLLQLVWGIDFAGETRTVDVHVATLRTKLGIYGGCIKTVRGVGYQMEETI